jgi:hypothetical protein
MNKPTSTKTLAHTWVLISAGILLYANGAVAAPSVGDAQQQARDLLLGTVNGAVTSIAEFPVVAAEGHSKATPDPQEQARQMILGTGHDGSVVDPAVASAPAVSARTNHRAYSDPQELARRFILGRG